MRYLYDKHKKDLPQVNPKNVSSGEDEESDNEEREVKFFWQIITNFKLKIIQLSQISLYLIKEAMGYMGDGVLKI